MLLVIDDVWMETIEQARRLREAAPQKASVLITTRSEKVRLALGYKLQALDKMPQEDGATLILDLVDDKQAKIYRPELEALSNVLEGHPLALSLAARQIGLNPQHSWINELLKLFERGIKDGDDFSSWNSMKANKKSTVCVYRLS